MNDLSQAKILLVDDKPEKLLALEAVLEDLGQQIVRAYSGRDALRCLLNEDFAVILLDVNMPGMDGFETASLIRELPELERLPIIALTAKAMKGDREKAIAAGASDYITKPVDSDQLISLLRVWLYE